MATLRIRGVMWVARVQWRDLNGQKKEKQIPLRTDSKVTALERLFAVEKVQNDIKEGLSFSFPWMNDQGQTKVKVLTLITAKIKWMEHRMKNKISKSTLVLNEQGLHYFLTCLGQKRPLNSIQNNDISSFIDYLEGKALSDTSINIHLRTVKAMFRHYLKYGTLDRIPIIDQRKVPIKDPIYITDQQFQLIMELPWLDDFYKRVFLLYRDTGMRIREPFMSTLEGMWIDIPPESKTHKKRSIELSAPLCQIFIELKEWHQSGYGSSLKDAGDHLSKMFKKALRSVKAGEDRHFHSLRHTFAVRKILSGTSIYDVKLLMGHSTVTTTEQYSTMNLKRAAQDFPTLVLGHSKGVKKTLEDTVLEGISHLSSGYVPLYEKIEG